MGKVSVMVVEGDRFVTDVLDDQMVAGIVAFTMTMPITILTHAEFGPWSKSI